MNSGGLYIYVLCVSSPIEMVCFFVATHSNRLICRERLCLGFFFEHFCIPHHKILPKLWFRHTNFMRRISMQTTATHEHCIFMMENIMVFHSIWYATHSTSKHCIARLHHWIDCEQAIKHGCFCTNFNNHMFYIQYHVLAVRCSHMFSA